MNSRLSRILLVVVIVLLATTFSFATGPRNINYMLVGGILLSPLVLLIRPCRVTLPHIDIPLIVFILLISISAIVWKPEFLRINALLFSYGFCIFFAMTARLVRVANFSANQLNRLIRYLVYAYTITLLVQQAAILFGWPVINRNFFHSEFPWKLNSLVAVPQLISFNLGLMMFFYAVNTRRNTDEGGLSSNIVRHPWVWIGYVWCLFSSVNSSAFIMFPLSLLPWISRKNAPVFLSLTIAALIGLTLVTKTMNLRHTDRIARFIPALVSLDVDELEKADGSMSQRIVPVIYTLGDLHPGEADFWLGHGMDADRMYVPLTPDGNRNEAYLTHVWYNYGFLANLALAWLTVLICFEPRRPMSWICAAAGIILLAYNTSMPIWLLLLFVTMERHIANPRWKVLKATSVHPRKHRVLVDMHYFDDTLIQGITTHLRGLYERVPALSPDIEFLFAARDIDKLQSVFGNAPNIRYIRLGKGGRINRLLTGFPMIIRRHHVDCAHFQYVSPIIKNCKTVVTLHDILFKDYRHLFPSSYTLVKGPAFRLSACRSDLLCAVSEYTRHRIESHYNISSDKICMIPNGVSPDLYSGDAPQLPEMPGKYILYVSRIEPRKNHHALIRAFDRLNLAARGYNLVFIGTETIPAPELYNALQDLDPTVREAVIIIPNVNAEELKSWYRHASLFVYPSLAEGFGIPPVEAGACGIPVICNNTTSLADYTFFGDNLIDIGNDTLLDRRIEENLASPPTDLRNIAAMIHDRYNWDNIARTFNNALRNIVFTNDD